MVLKKTNKQPNKLEYGQAFEQLAEAFLIEKNARVLARNFKTRQGELDRVIFLDGVVVFVEVRFRRNTTYGDPLETVTPAKQKRLQLAAEAFLHTYSKWQSFPCRFDVIAITEKASKLTHCTNAHKAQDRLALSGGASQLPTGNSPSSNLPITPELNWVQDAFQVSAW